MDDLADRTVAGVALVVEAEAEAREARGEVGLEREEAMGVIVSYEECEAFDSFAGRGKKALLGVLSFCCLL
jgi:hypothetical protein